MMTHRMKKCFCILLAIVMVSSGVTRQVYAQPVEQTEDIVNNDKVELLEKSDLSEEVENKQEGDVIYLENYSQVFNYGFIEEEGDEEIESIYARPFDEMDTMEEESKLPEKYVNENLPNTRSQGEYGTCWAHASIAVAEANLMKTGILEEDAIDTSELHLAYFSYHTTEDPLGGISQDVRAVADTGKNYLDQGGNNEQATRTLFAWLGAADEETAPYSQCSIAKEQGLDHKIAFEDIAHIKNAYVINPVQEREEAKRLVYEYGAITVSYFATQPGDYVEEGGVGYDFQDFYNYDHNAYYCPFVTTTNHAVTIVGWDDNFSKENFSVQPEGDGAWLIRNSWSSYNSQNIYGYFWISYYDKSLYSESYAYEMDTADNYDNNYQYDGTYFSGNSGWDICANVFEVKAKEKGESLEAIAFETDNTNLDYVVEIYTELEEDGDPSTGKLTAIRKGSTKYAGYHTVELDHPVTLNYGERFAVVVKLLKDDYSVGIKCERTSNGNVFKTNFHIEKAQSYVYSNNQWKDWYSDKAYYGNFCIKAYTKNMVERVPANDILLPEITPNGITIGVEEEYQLLAMALPVAAENKSIFYQSSDEKVVTVTKDGKLTGVGKGTANITVTTTNGISKSFTVNVVEKVNTLSITGEEWLYVGETYSYTSSWTPSFVIPNGTVEFSSDDPTIVQIDKNTGEAIALKSGITYIRAQLDGVSDAIEVNVRANINSSNFKVVVDRDSVVTFTWKTIKGAIGYEITTEDGQVLDIFDEDGRQNYSFTDTTYQGATQPQTLWYALKVRDNIGYMTQWFNATVGPAKKVNYVISHAANHEDNPSYYRPGTYYYLQNPIVDPGYYFEGWYKDETYENYVWSISSDETEDLTLYAKITPITYSVIFYSNDILNSVYQAYVQYDQNLFLSRYQITRDGYELVGWNTKADGTGTHYEPEQIIKNLTTEFYGNVKLYAQWKKVYTSYCKSPTLMIEGEIEDGILGESDWVVVSLGAKIVLKGEVQDSIYYAFVDSDGMIIGEYQQYVESIPVLGETRIAIYAARPHQTMVGPSEVKTYGFKVNTSNYKIKYIISHGSNHKENPVGYDMGESFILQNAYADIGYLFEGWYLDGDYRNKTEGILTTDTGDLCFYAKIIPISYTIAYCSNDGTDKKETVDTVYDKNIFIKDSIFIREGYEFKEWNTKEDGSGVSYGEWEVVSNLTTIHNDTVSLYAQWEKLEEESAGFRIEGLEKQYPYTGSNIKPAFKVYDGSQELALNKDYKVSYKNNKKAGYATIIIRGVGKYKNELETGFEILPMDISLDIFGVDSLAVSYNQKEQKPVPVLYYGSKKLSAKNDYFIEYYKTKVVEGEYQKFGEALSSVREVGRYKACIVGKGNYSNIREVDLYVVAEDKALLSKAKVSKISSINYTGSGYEPKPEITYENEVLKENVHYTLQYYNNKEIGTAWVVIQGIEESGYSGSKRVNFVIKGSKLKANFIQNLDKNFEYTGKEIEPFGKVDDNTDTGWAYFSIFNEGQEVVLKKGTDYKVVSYNNNKNAGTANVVIEGINGYSGKINVKFKIKAVKALGKEILVNYATETSYAKGGAKAEIYSVKVALYDRHGNRYLEELKEGKDFTVSYKNNKSVTTEFTYKYPIITIKGKGNYSGVLATRAYEITPREVSGLKIVAHDKVFKNATNNHITKLEIVDPITNKKLDKKDYNIKFKYYYDEDVWVEVKEKETKTLLLREKNTEVKKTDIIPAGTWIRVETEGINGYYGKILARYRIALCDFSKAKVKIKEKEYTGQPVRITKEDILYVKINGQELKDTDYRIVNDYSNNTNVGNATVVLEGRDNYGGRKKVPFKIGKKKMFFGLGNF